MRKNKLFLLLALLLTAATGAWAQTTVTFTASDLADRSSITKDGVTLTANGQYGINMNGVNGPGEFTNSLGGNFTKIVVTADGLPSGDGWSAGTWTGSASSVSFTGNIDYWGNEFSIVCTLETAAPTTYTVSLADNVKDADKWTITPNEGLKEGDQVTLTYTGRLKVKGVKATSDAAPASVPDGALSGVFSVSDSKKVYFSKGNLRYASGAWSFFDNQYDYYADYSEDEDAWDKFGWSTPATTYGKNTSQSSNDYSGDFVDWGATMGTGWFTLSKDEWTYLLNTRTVNGGTGNGKSYTLGQRVNGKLGLVIYPDNYTGAVYSGSDWATFESAGCVFLPAAGLRSGLTVYSQGTDGYYGSATPSDEGSAYSVYFASGSLNPASDDGRSNACTVRLVREVATSEEEPAAVPVTAITLNKTETTITKVNGTATETLSVTTVAPDEATDKTYTWSSDNEAAATVDADGKVTAVAVGTAHIRATANDGSGVYGECTVTVTDLSAYYSKMVECGCDGDLDDWCVDGGDPSNPFTGQVLTAAQAIALAQAKAAETGSNCAVFYGGSEGIVHFAKNDGTTGSTGYWYNAAAKGLSGYRGFYVSK